MTVKDLMIHYLPYFFDTGCSVFTKIGYAAKILGRNLSLTTESLVQNNLITRTKNERIEEERKVKTGIETFTAESCLNMLCVRKSIFELLFIVNTIFHASLDNFLPRKMPLKSLYLNMGR